MKIFYKNSTISARDFINKNLEGEPSFLRKVQEVIRFWLLDTDTYTLKTSGSTGEPSNHSFTKKQFYLSAQNTIDYFGLTRKDNLFCCLPAEHAAGMMMIIRTLVLDAGLILAEPARLPLLQVDNDVPIHFAAFVPYQFASSFDHGESREKMERISKIILGGGSISPSIVNKINQLKTNVYHTYGMTETLTHIAVRKINGFDAEEFYQPLKNIHLSSDSNSCLEITSPVTLGVKIRTNDMVQLNDDHSFHFLGRRDNIVNSAGVKINTERLKNRTADIIEKYFGDTDYFFSAMSDDLLGQKLVLFVEYTEISGMFLQGFERELKATLSKYEIPKNIIFIEKFEKTLLGKTDKEKTKIKYIRGE